jgi:transposase InsO family protein
VATALEHTELSARELAGRIPDREGHFPSESSVYRIPKAYHLLRNPACVVMSAADRFQHPTRRPNELWLTDFSSLWVVGRGWHYLSTVLDDYSRKILAWPLSAAMRAADVTETLEPGAGRHRSGPGSARATGQPCCSALSTSKRRAAGVRFALG